MVTVDGDIKRGRPQLTLEAVVQKHLILWISWNTILDRDPWRKGIHVADPNSLGFEAHFGLDLGNSDSCAQIGQYLAGYNCILLLEIQNCQWITILSNINWGIVVSLSYVIEYFPETPRNYIKPWWCCLPCVKHFQPTEIISVCTHTNPIHVGKMTKEMIYTFSPITSPSSHSAEMKETKRDIEIYKQRMSWKQFSKGVHKHYQSSQSLVSYKNNYLQCLLNEQ